MNDRFKYRAYITSTIDIATSEEKEVSFYIDGVAVYEDGDIGFSRDKLLDALDKLDLTKNQKEQIESDISENSYCRDYDWFSIDFGEKEQCTGLKDKNGKLIYEGDIVESNFNGLGRILYNHAALTVAWKEEVYFYGHRTPSTPIPLDVENIEIIGNIHENPELLK